MFSASRTHAPTQQESCIRVSGAPSLPRRCWGCEQGQCWTQTASKVTVHLFAGLAQSTLPQLLSLGTSFKGGNFVSVPGSCRELGSLRAPQLLLRMWFMLSNISCVQRVGGQVVHLTSIRDKSSAALFSCAVGGAKVWNEAQSTGLVRLHLSV